MAGNHRVLEEGVIAPVRRTVSRRGLRQMLRKRATDVPSARPAQGRAPLAPAWLAICSPMDAAAATADHHQHQETA
jgi:hypothetical protein